MKITVLVDNNTFDFIPPYLLGQSALSFFIETGKYKYLFDVGYSDTIIQNAESLKINILEVDQIIISHSHIDHTHGLETLGKLLTKRTNLVAHPYAFLKRFYPNLNGIQIGIHFPLKTLEKYFNLIGKDKVYEIDENLYFLGQIPRNNNFEKSDPIGVLETGEEDNNLDDTALVYKSSKGLVIITGCSHSGVCNIIEYAKQICDENKIHDVIGGFHLLKPNKKQLQGTLKYFETLKADVIHPCHCTDLNSKIALSQVANIAEVGSGLVLEYD